MLSPVEAGEYLRLSEQRLARCRLDGSGPPFYKIGRSVRYRKEDLDAWLSLRARVSTSDTGTAQAAA